MITFKIIEDPVDAGKLRKQSSSHQAIDEEGDFNDFMQKNLDGKSRQRMINRNNKIEKSFVVEVILRKYHNLNSY
ncbi:MAG: hypothetical protein ACR2LN_01165 [Candidatus Levyibacteriota bacterium]